MKTRKSPLRTLSVLLTVAMLFGVFACLPVGAVEELTDGDFKYTVQNGEATITGYTGNGGDVTIPSTLGGHPVKVIGEKAFNNCTFSMIYIPDSVQTIEGYAFRNCDSLRYIFLPASVTTVGSYLFDFCDGLTDVYCEAKSQPSGWASDWAKGDAYLGQDFLLHWGASRSDNPSVRPHEGDFTYVVKGNEATIIGYTGNDEEVDIPSTLGGYPVTEIRANNNIFGGSLFHHYVTHVTLPEGLKTIAHHTFSGCDFETITLPSTLVSIGYNAFGSNPSLKFIFIPKSVQVMEADYTIDGNTGPFAYCNALTDVYCEAEEQPEGWDPMWTYDYHGEMGFTVHWGVSRSDVPNLSVNPTTLGDLSGDETLNANDYMMLKRYVLHTFKLTDEQIAVSDINGDGSVNSLDYMMLKRAVLGTYKLPTA